MTGHPHGDRCGPRFGIAMDAPGRGIGRSAGTTNAVGMPHDDDAWPDGRTPSLHAHDGGEVAIVTDRPGLVELPLSGADRCSAEPCHEPCSPLMWKDCGPGGPRTDHSMQNVVDGPRHILRSWQEETRHGAAHRPRQRIPPHRHCECWSLRETSTTCWPPRSASSPNSNPALPCEGRDAIGIVDIRSGALVGAEGAFWASLDEEADRPGSMCAPVAGQLV
jgi:hypothetical protein